MTNNNKATFKDSSPAEEKLNALTHALGVVIGLIAFILLMDVGWKHKNIPYLLAMGVYSLSFIWTYFTSTLYHTLHQAHTAQRKYWHLLDHTAIYLFIAGTYTPVALFALPDGWSWGILIGIWTLALAGIFSKVFFIGRYQKLSLVFYLAMGWMILIAIEPLIAYAPHGLLYWLLAGGIFYSLGTLFFSWRRLKFNHAIWHFFVLAGSLCHLYGIYQFLGSP